MGKLKSYLDEARYLLKKYDEEGESTEELTKEQEIRLIIDFTNFRYVYPSTATDKGYLSPLDNVIKNKAWLVNKFGQKTYDEAMNEYQEWRNQCEESRANGLSTVETD